MTASLQFAPLVAATEPSWQAASDRQEQAQAGGQASGTPTAPAPPSLRSRSPPK